MIVRLGRESVNWLTPGGDLLQSRKPAAGVSIKSLVAVVALAALVLLLASACGGGGKPAATPEPGAPSTGKIAFTSFRDLKDEIYVMNADGSVVTRVTNNNAFQPAWSPMR